MNNLVKGYVNNLTINNINDFGLKNNIKLEKKELNFLLELVKKDYQNIIDGNITDILVSLKENLSNENYDKVVNLYNEYREKYSPYLK